MFDKKVSFNHMYLFLLLLHIRLIVYYPKENIHENISSLLLISEALYRHHSYALIGSYVYRQ